VNARRRPLVALTCGVAVAVAGSLLPGTSAGADSPVATPSWETYGNVLADPNKTSFENVQVADAGPSGTVISTAAAPSNSEAPWNEAELRVGLLPRDAGQDIRWVSPADGAVWYSYVAGDGQTGDAAVVFRDVGTDIGACDAWEVATFDAGAASWAEPRALPGPLADPEDPESCPLYGDPPRVAVTGGAAHVLLSGTSDNAPGRTITVHRVPVDDADLESTVLATDVREVWAPDPGHTEPDRPFASLGVAPDGSVHAAWGVQSDDHYGEIETFQNETHVASTGTDGLAWSEPTVLQPPTPSATHTVRFVGDRERLLLVAQTDLWIEPEDEGGAWTNELHTTTSELTADGAGVLASLDEAPVLTETQQSTDGNVALRGQQDPTRLFVLDDETPSGLREIERAGATDDAPTATGLDASGRLWAASPCSEQVGRVCASRWEPSTDGWVDEGTLPTTVHLWWHDERRSQFAFVPDSGSPVGVAVLADHRAWNDTEDTASTQLARRPSVGPEAPSPDWQIAETLDAGVDYGETVGASPAGSSGAVIAARTFVDLDVVLRAGIIPAGRDRPTTWGPSSTDMDGAGSVLTAGDPETGDAAVIFHERPVADADADHRAEVWTWSGEDRAWSGPVVLDRASTVAGRPTPTMTVVDGDVHVLRREATTAGDVELVHYAVPVGGAEFDADVLDAWDEDWDVWEAEEGWAYQYEFTAAEAAAGGSVHALWARPSAAAVSDRPPYVFQHAFVDAPGSDWSDPTVFHTVDDESWASGVLLRDGDALVAVAQSSGELGYGWDTSTVTAVLDDEGANERRESADVPPLRDALGIEQRHVAIEVSSHGGTTGVLVVDYASAEHVRVLPEPAFQSPWDDRAGFGRGSDGRLWAVQHQTIVTWDVHLRRWTEQPALPSAIEGQERYEGEPVYALLPDPTAPTGIAVVASVIAEGGWPFQPVVLRDGATVVTPYPTPTDTGGTVSPPATPPVVAPPVLTPPTYLRPRPVADLRARTKRNGDVVVRWGRGPANGVQAVTGYRVRVGGKVRVIDRRTKPRWVHKAARDGKRYRYVVRATNDAGASKPRAIRHRA
jgi:hypothetical protein